MDNNRIRKKLRRKAFFRDAKRRKNILKRQLGEIRNGRRRGFSIEYPLSRKVVNK